MADSRPLGAATIRRNSRLGFFCLVEFYLNPLLLGGDITLDLRAVTPGLSGQSSWSDYSQIVFLSAETAVLVINRSGFAPDVSGRVLPTEALAVVIDVSKGSVRAQRYLAVAKHKDAVARVSDRAFAVAGLDAL